MGWSADRRLSVLGIAQLGNRHQVLVCVLASALTLLLNLQSQRVFVPTMIFVVDQSNRTQLLANAAVVFLSIALVGLLATLFSLRTAAWICSLLLILSRLIVQFSADPNIRWLVAAVGVVVSGWLIVLLALVDRNALATAIPVAFWLDLSLRTQFDTIDIAYMSNPTKNLITFALAACLILFVALVRWPQAATELNWTGSVSLVGFGPGLVAFALVSGNLGLAAVMTGNRLAYNYWLLCLAPIVAFAYWSGEVAAWPWVGRLKINGWPLTAAIALAGAVGLTLIWTQVEQEIVAGIALVLFSTSALLLLMTCVAGTRDQPAFAGAWHTTVMFTSGMCIQAALVFLYFASSGSFFYLGVAFGLLAAFAFAPTMRQNARIPMVAGMPAAHRTSFVVVMAMSLVMASDFRDEYFTVDLDAEITVVTYNIQNGFSADNVWDLEATARTIEGLDPDIVLLQETGRGWFAMGWADQVWWLSNRLEMDFVFGPASLDNLWGNAILSAAPLLEPDILKYTASQNLHRSVVSAEIPVPGRTLWVASTHLDNPSNAAEVRTEQTEQLLAEWGGTTPAIVGGDFNALPDSDVVSMMESAGFADSAAVAGNPETTSESGNRIDYIFVTTDVAVVSATAPDVWTSDHRPLRVDLILLAE